MIPERKPTSVVQQFLQSAIASGDYRPGSKLPTERELSTRLGVPRNAVRDALSVLEAQKKVVRIVGSGTYLPDEVPAPPEEAEPQDASPSAIMATRLVVEPGLASLVVVHATAADLDRMQDCIRRSEETDDLAGFEIWDAALHQAVADATHNPLIRTIYAVITRARDHAPWGDLKRRSITAERRDLYRQEHRDIVAALRARDASAASLAMTRHLERVRQNLLGS